MLNCPACDNSGALKTDGYIAFCKNCGHRWREIEDIIYEQILETNYPESYAGYRPDSKFLSASRRLIDRHIAPRVAPPAKLLDVGCGAGDFRRVAKDAGYDVYGIDASRASVEHCAAKGVTTVAEDFLTYDFGTKFDVISMIDVVEHLDDPGRFADRVVDLLNPGGLFYVKIPAFGDLTVHLSNAFPRLSGLLLGTPGHCQFFDRESMQAFLSRKFASYEFFDVGSGGMRTANNSGSAKQKLARRARKFIRRASGDENLYLAAFSDKSPIQARAGAEQRPA